MKGRFLAILMTAMAMLSFVLPGGTGLADDPIGGKGPSISKDKITATDLKAAAANFKAAVAKAKAAGGRTSAALVTDSVTGAWIPDYFGNANWAFSPPLAKFVDSLPGLGPTKANNLNQYVPVAVPETYADGSDYYEIAVVEYEQQLHSQLPPTRLRGYVQLSTAARPGAQIPLFNPDGSPIMMPDGVTQARGFDRPHFLGPTIVAKGALDGSAGTGTPVRIKFYNLLPTGAGGGLFIPVDRTVMGAGMFEIDNPAIPGSTIKGEFTDNRATIHLHGNNTVWISDGTPHQWVTPANETTPYPKGVSVRNVPDMPDPGKGAMTFYYTNAQSARLQFYHDHAFGITRLNVYAGEAAAYVITDQVEQDLIGGTNVSGVNPGLLKVLPDIGIPLVIQDRTFVDPATIGSTDPTWLDPNQRTFGTTPGVPKLGDLWYPHVYMPAQNPTDPSGTNAFGRWMYGPWFYPPTANLDNGPIPNPYCLPTPPPAESYPNGAYDCSAAPWESPYMPATPNPSMPGEAFMDTPLVNGTAYPFMNVEPKAYRFRVLNAANDRFFNLQMYVADPAVVTGDGRTNTEVRMVPAAATAGFPADWPTDGREGGVPDPTMAGPDWIQIANEGGFLPAPVVVPNQPVGWNQDPTNFNFGVVNRHSLVLGTAERADVIVDFSKYAGRTLILYNDAPAAFPAPDARYDFYTGDPDRTENGGAPSTLPGYGPNTRTIMQIRVGGSGSFNVGSIDVSSGGSGYTAPTVALVGGAPIANAAAIANGVVDRISLNTLGSGYTSAPAVTIAPPASGATATAIATVFGGVVTGITVTNGGSGYNTAPAVTIAPPASGATATAKATLAISGITVTNPGGGYSSTPVVAISDPGGTGAGSIATAFLLDTAAPPSYNLAALQAVFAKGPGTKRGVFERSQDPIIVPQEVYNSAYNASLTSVSSQQFAQVNENSKTFTPLNADGTLATTATLPIQPKASHDEMGGVYDTQYGRMSGMLGLEMPATTSQIALFVPYGYASPPVDIMAGSVAGNMIRSLDDGTQIWKISQNGVDSHTIHFHLFNVQLINRVGWDGMMLPPDPTELGWKETIRVNPLEQTFIALRPMLPSYAQVPFLDQVPNSMRLIDPTKPTGALLDAPPPAGWFNPNGVSIASITNHAVNFGWEYVYHCHILAHEEMDMMHTTSFAVPPKAPTGLAAAVAGVGNGRTVVLTWTDSSLNETGFTVQRANDISFTLGLTSFPVGQNEVTFTDRPGTTLALFYRVLAFNRVGDITLGGFPTVTARSAPSAPVAVTPSNFPSTGVLDNFNRANGPLGANWNGSNAYSIVSNQAAVPASGGNALWLPTTFGPGQEAYVTLTGINAPNFVALDLKLNGSNPDLNTSSLVRVVYFPATNVVRVQTRVAGGNFVNQLFSSVAFAAGDTLGARLLANGVLTVYKNGIVILTNDLTTGPNPWPASLVQGGGRVGLQVGQQSSSVPFSRFDNFGGGTIP